MTKPAIVLTEVLENGANADQLKQIIQFVAQRMMGSTSKACVLALIRF
jgi:putative transposase